MDSKKFEEILSQVQKPARYIGNEPHSILKKNEDIDVRFAFCFPDIYEIGMSHLGLKILYSLLNNMPKVACERVFAPWPDMEKQLKGNNIPLYSLESKTALNEFDIIGFTLQYELSFTNVLNMLSLAKIPILANKRKTLENLVVAGGPCTCNPEVLSDIVDVFFLGEGEESLPKFINLYKEAKKNNESKISFLKKVCNIDGIYVPSFYEVKYNEDKTIKEVLPKNNAPKKVKKSIIKDLSNSYYHQSFPEPMIEIVHDRAEGEIFRGCIRGCRFCQAGYIYRPVRQKSAKVVNDQCKKLCENTGHSSLSLCSLSTSDYEHLDELIEMFDPWTKDKKISISLPSLRINSISERLLNKISTFKKAGLTFAPEAGTQRLRNVINKNVSEEEIFSTCEKAFKNGWKNLKLYFMIGLPCETNEDIKAIPQVAQEIINLYYKNNKKSYPPKVIISAAAFIPKPFTPFQWEAQDTVEELIKKQEILKESNKCKKVKCNYHDAKSSFIEAVFARGDRKLNKVLIKAHELGLKFDSWSEYFDFEKWLEVFKECDIDPEFYACRKRSFDEVLPWDHIDYGIDKEFLINECKKAYKEETSPNCLEKCNNCGASCFKGGICYGEH